MTTYAVLAQETCLVISCSVRSPVWQNLEGGVDYVVVVVVVIERGVEEIP